MLKVRRVDSTSREKLSLDLAELDRVACCYLLDDTRSSTVTPLHPSLRHFTSVLGVDIYQTDYRLYIAHLQPW
jgi:hypothetical protein